MSSRHRLPLAAVFAAVATAAEAHPGAAHVHSLADGLAHPLTGADHLLAMVAVGLIAARAAGRGSSRRLPLFLGMMIVGAALGAAGMGVGMAETGIALSLLALGAIVAAARPLPLPRVRRSPASPVSSTGSPTARKPRSAGRRRSISRASSWRRPACTASACSPDGASPAGSCRY